jgi:hypothetical protein
MMLFASVVAPMVVCASRVQLASDAAHDEAVVRGLGLGFTGAFRALDVLAAHVFLWLPLGTLAFRAGLTSAGLCGVAGGLLFVLAKRLLASCKSAPRVSAIVAALASVCASLTGAWVVESATAGSSVLGVVLALLPVVLVSMPAERRSWAMFAGAMGLALSYEPLVGAVAGAGSLGYMLGDRSPSSKATLSKCVLGFALGCLPFGLSWVYGHFAAERLGDNAWASPMGEGAQVGARSVVEVVGSELGWILGALGLLGAALALLRRRSRASGAAVLGVLVASAASVALGAPAGPWRFGAPALLLVGAAAVLAGVALQWVVVAVAEARVPLAPASAAMVLLLALTFPVLTLDDAVARSEARDTGGTRAWDDVAFEALPPSTLLLVADRGLYARALASRATGELRVDLSLVPSFDVGSTAAARELAGVPDLIPLLRDYALFGEARERTLSSIAATRPLAFGLVPSWEHALSRHVVPSGLFAVFYAEPRGASERLHAIDDAEASLEPLHDAIVPPGDAELAKLTARILDARARSLASLGEKDAATKVTDDSLALALSASRGARRARRLVTSRFSRATTSR